MTGEEASQLRKENTELKEGFVAKIDPVGKKLREQEQQSEKYGFHLVELPYRLQ